MTRQPSPGPSVCAQVGQLLVIFAALVGIPVAAALLANWPAWAVVAVWLAGVFGRPYLGRGLMRLDEHVWGHRYPSLHDD